MIVVRSLIAVFAAGLAAPLFATTAPPPARVTAPAPSAGITRDQALQNAAREFAAMDTNKDGKLSLAEIEAYRRPRLLAALRARNSSAFDRLDADKNGSISREEFARLVPGDVKMNFAPMIAKADKNGDGQLSAEEFSALAAENFARRDRNSDGVVSSSEAGAR